jgi:hypothetical protein
MSKNATKIFNEMMDRALEMSVCSQGDQVRLLRRQWARGETPELPEKHKPGYLLKFLSPDEREELANLKSEDVARQRLNFDWITHWW